MSCSEYDQEFGLGLVPDDQITTMKSVSYDWSDLDGKLNAYLCQEEGLLATGLGAAIIGNYADTSFGEISASSYIQYAPGFYSDDDYDDLSNYTAQDLYIYFPLSEKLVVSGDEDVTQRYYIYMAEAQMDEDSIYYTNFKIFNKGDNSNEAYMGLVSSAADSMFYFELTSSTNKYVQVFACEGKETELEEFMASLVAADGDAYSNSTSDFLDDFNGFYIAAAENTSLLISSELAYVSMKLYTLNEDYVDEDDPDAIDDITLYYYFDDSDVDENRSLILLDHSYENVSWNSTVHVYPFEYSSYYDDDYEYYYDEIEGVDAPDASSLVTDGVSYVQSLCGVTTMLEFTDAFSDMLKELRYNEEDGEIVYYPNIVVNRALITFPLTGDYDNTSMIKRLGMFYDYQNSLWMPDYLFSYEQSGYAIEYNGYINTASNKYTMDIYMYIQRLLLTDQEYYENTPRFVNMTPDISYTYNIGQVELDLTGITLELIYTLVK